MGLSLLLAIRTPGRDLVSLVFLWTCSNGTQLCSNLADRSVDVSYDVSIFRNGLHGCSVDEGDSVSATV